LAVNKLTEEDLYYSSRKRQNGKMVPMKTNRGYSFKKEEIYKNMALILVDAGKPKRQKKGD
jgi:hypothetical protein